MKLELSDNMDFWSGMMLIGFGAAAVFFARDYPFGSVLRIGPGFFPTVLGGILIVFGICLMVVGIHSKEKIKGRLSFRALMLLFIALVLFGILMEYAGFLPALIVLIIVSEAAGRQFKAMEMLISTAILVLFAMTIFIWGLNLPFPLVKGF